MGDIFGSGGSGDNSQMLILAAGAALLCCCSSSGLGYYGWTAGWFKGTDPTSPPAGDTAADDSTIEPTTATNSNTSGGGGGSDSSGGGGGSDKSSSSKCSSGYKVKYQYIPYSTKTDLLKGTPKPLEKVLVYDPTTDGEVGSFLMAKAFWDKVKKHYNCVIDGKVYYFKSDSPKSMYRAPDGWKYGINKNEKQSTQYAVSAKEDGPLWSMFKGQDTGKIKIDKSKKNPFLLQDYCDASDGCGDCDILVTAGTGPKSPKAATTALNLKENVRYKITKA